MDQITKILPHSSLVSFCSKWKVKALYVFGSILNPNFNSNSDIDIMVEFASDASWSLLDHAMMVDELMSITGRSVDLLTKKSIERSSNKLRKEEILRTAQVIYDSAA